MLEFLHCPLLSSGHRAGKEAAHADSVPVRKASGAELKLSPIKQSCLFCFVAAAHCRVEATPGCNASKNVCKSSKPSSILPPNQSLLLDVRPSASPPPSKLPKCSTKQISNSRIGSPTTRRCTSQRGFKPDGNCDILCVDQLHEAHLKS